MHKPDLNLGPGEGHLSAIANSPWAKTIFSIPFPKSTPQKNSLLILHVGPINLSRPPPDSLFVELPSFRFTIKAFSDRLTGWLPVKDGE